MIIENLIADVIKLGLYLLGLLTYPGVEIRVVVAEDLSFYDFAQLPRMQRLQGIKLGGTLPEAFLEPTGAPFRRLDGGSWQSITLALFQCERDWPHLDIEIGRFFPAEELNLTGDGNRH